MEIQILTDADSVSEFIKMVDYLEKLGYKQIMESSSTTHYYALLKRANAKSSNENSGLNIDGVTNRTLNEKKPVRYRCLLCGRDKFTRKSPHNCTGGFRRRNIKWLPIFE